MAEEQTHSEKVEIAFHHFEWLNREILRLGDEVRTLTSSNYKLRQRVSELESAIISGAIVPDANPEDSSR